MIESSFERMNHEIHINTTTFEDKEKRERFLCVGTFLNWRLDYVERINIIEQDKGIVYLTH